MRARLVLLLSCLSGACQFGADVPPQAVVRCDESGQCPVGFACRPRVGLCVRPDAQSGDAPRITQATVTPSRARSGDVVRVTLTSSKPLLVPPQLSLLQPSGARLVTLTSSSGLDFTFSYDVDATRDEEGSHRFAADLIDTTGTEALSQPVGVVAFDFTAARVVESSFSAPRGSADGGALVLRPDEAPAVRVALSEPTRLARLVASSSCDAGVSFTARTADGALLDFVADGPGGVGCAYGLTLQGATDLAGNVTPDALLPLRFVVDGTAPTITSLQVSREVDGGLVDATAFSRQPEFSRWVLRFETDDTAVSVVARLDDAVLPCLCAAQACRCTGVVDAASTEGAHSFSVSASDIAGNASNAARQVRFDFTTPSIVPSSRQVTLVPPPGCPRAAVSALGDGGVLQVGLSLDEEGTAQLDAAAGLDVVAEPSTPTHFSFLARVGRTTPQGATPLLVTVTDVVGNRAKVPLGFDVVVDSVAPSAPDVTSTTAITYRRSPWGSRDAGASFSVVGLPGAAEAGALLEVRDTVTALASTLVQDAGFLAALPLLDRPVVSVRVIDGACNQSPTVAVRNVEWLATLNGKTPGRSFENPHRLESRGAFSSRAVVATATETSLAAGPVVAQGLLAWSRRGGLPSPRGALAQAFDASRGRVVLFGGGDSATMNDELWEYEPLRGQWENRTPTVRPPNWPSARTSAAMVFDSKRSKLILFGGRTFAGALDDVWEWDGTLGEWTDRSTVKPAPWPVARFGHGLAFDSARGITVLFGGFAGNGGVVSDGLWEWNTDQATWRNATPEPRPAIWPSARSAAGFVFDAARQKLVLFGGRALNAVTNDELWEYTPATATWENRSPTLRPSAWPSARADLGCVFDTVRGRTLCFTGSSGGVRTDDVWELDGVSGTWLNRLPTPRPTSWITPRDGLGVAYDASRGTVLAFGGLTAPNVYSGGTWEFSTAPGTWLNRTVNPIVRPSARSNHAMTFDSKRGKALVYGGSSNGTLADGLWEWDSAAGTFVNRMPVQPTGWPADRELLGLAYDARRDTVVLFGGVTDAGRSDELWEWSPDAGTWSSRTPSVRPTAWPSAASSHALAYDPPSQQVVLFGGFIADGGRTDEVWSWNGTTWLNRTPTPRSTPWPVARSAFGNLAYSAVNGRLMLFGGNGSSPFDSLLGFSTATNQWVDYGVSPRPPAWPAARFSLATAYDATRGTLALFGGANPAGNLDDLWEWSSDAGTWRNTTPTVRPLQWPNERQRHAMTTDTANQKVVMFGGNFVNGDTNELWELAADTATRPGLVAQFNFAQAGAEPTAVVNAVSARVVAGATGGLGAGFALSNSLGDDVTQELSDPAAVDAPAEVTWQTSDATRISGLFGGPDRRLCLAVTPLTNNELGRLGRVRLDWVEVLVRYRRP